MTENNQQVMRDEIQMLVFTLEDVCYGVDVHQVREVKNFDNVTPVPYAQVYVKGVTNLRGEVVPVIDLHKRFGFVDKKAVGTIGTMIIIQGNHPVGVMVDSVLEVLTLPKASIESKSDDLAAVSSDAIVGFANHENRLIILVDLKKIVSTTRQAE